MPTPARRQTVFVDTYELNKQSTVLPLRRCFYIILVENNINNSSVVLVFVRVVVA